MVTVPHKMVGLERMLDYRGVGLQRFHCVCVYFVSMEEMFTRALISCLRMDVPGLVETKFCEK